MSFYIFTPISNLNNILSTETISPASLYTSRKHGFRHIDRPDKARYDDRIFLYKGIPKKPISVSGDLMALRLDNCTPICKESEGLLWTDETFFITPSTCAFLFASEDEKDDAWLSLKRSSEAKFTDTYEERSALFIHEPRISKTITPSLKVTAEEFEMLDRLKGAIFCFFLGQLYSVKKDDEIYFKNYFEVLDLLINSITQEIPSKQEAYLSYLNKILLCLGMKKALKNDFKDTQVAYSEDRALEMSPQSIYAQIGLNLIDGLTEDSKLTDDEIRNLRSSFEDRFFELIDTRPSGQRPSICKVDERPCFSLPKDEPLADSLIDTLVQNDMPSKTNNDMRYGFARECALTIRECCGDFWNGSGEQEYVNSLLLHLNEGTPFDPNNRKSIDNKGHLATLKALTQLCSNNNNNKDLEDYYLFLRKKCSVADFRLPFCLWGATFGFSAMPKTMTNRLAGTAAETNARKLFRDALDILSKDKEALIREQTMGMPMFKHNIEENQNDQPSVPNTDPLDSPKETL